MKSLGPIFILFLILGTAAASTSVEVETAHVHVHVHSLPARGMSTPTTGTVVPEGALVTQGQTTFIYTLERSQQKTRAHRTRVITGQRRNGTVEILKGLTPDDEIIVHAAQPLWDGAPVEKCNTEISDHAMEGLADTILGNLFSDDL
ncbi:MAG: hypothetical protein MI747_02415 [Desulfobacterales bacterium]|nr:hypothetical protein [Desulfobacterales bacterium]